MKWQNVQCVEKLRMEEQKSKKNLGIDMTEQYLNHGVENVEVWEVVADIQIVRIGVKIILAVIILLCVR